MPPESRHGRNIPQHNKSYIWQTHSKHYPQWQKIESISSTVRNKTRVPTLTTTIQHSLRSPSHRNQRRKRNKRYPNWKRRSKTLTVCRWHDPLHRKPQRHHQKITRANQWISKLQHIKFTHINPLHSYTLTMRKQKEKLRKQSHSPLRRKEKNRNTFT